MADDEPKRKRRQPVRWEARMARMEAQQTLIIALMRSHDANIGVMDAKFEAKFNREFNRDGRADGRNGSAHR